MHTSKIEETCPHCGAPAGKTCAEWNGGLELKYGCPPRMTKLDRLRVVRQAIEDQFGKPARAALDLPMRAIADDRCNVHRCNRELGHEGPHYAGPTVGMTDHLRAHESAHDKIAAKLIVSRIHRVAARLGSGFCFVDELRTELYELADEIEERLTR